MAHRPRAQGAQDRAQRVRGADDAEGDDVLAPVQAQIGQKAHQRELQRRPRAGFPNVDVGHHRLQLAKVSDSEDAWRQRRNAGCGRHARPNDSIK